MGRILFLSIFAALAAGCATSPPRRDLPSSLAIPQEWTSTNAAGNVEDRWWHDLGDENLPALVDEALRHNHELSAAAARLEAALAQARIAGAALYPAADFAFDAQRWQQNFVGLPIPGASDRVLTSRSTVYGASLNLSWELDIWGRVRAGRRAAVADAQVAESDLRGAFQSIAGQTAKAWVANIEAARQLVLAQSTVSNYTITANQVRERYELGIRSPLDVRLATASRASARALAGQRTTVSAVSRRQLEILLGRYPEGSLHLTNDLPELGQDVPAGLPSELIERRPDLIAAERRWAATGTRVAEAKAALFPRISLTASGGRSSAELEDLLSDQFKVWAIAANLVQPIFEGGRLRAAVRLARAREKEAMEKYLSAVLQAFAEVETALANEYELAQRQRDLFEATNQSIAALRLAEERYRAGIEDFVTLLEAQRRALEAESQWLAVRRQRVENRIDLHLALGGGFPRERGGFVGLKR